MCGNNLGGWPLGTMSLVTVCFKQTEQKLGETVEDYDAKKMYYKGEKTHCTISFLCFLGRKPFQVEKCIKMATYTLIIWKNFGIELFQHLRSDNILSRVNLNDYHSTW